MADAVVGALRVVLGMDTATFETGLKRAESHLQKFGITAKLSTAALVTAVGAAAAGIGFAIKKSIDAADELGKASQKIGIPVEQLSLLQYALEQNEVSMEQFVASAVKLNKALAETAAGGTGPAADAFAALGIKVRDASGAVKGNEQALLEIATKFEGFRDGANKTALAVTLLGKSGAQLIPFLNEGAKGIERLKEEARKLGLLVTTETALAADAFNDDLNTLSKISTAAARSIAGPLVAALAALTTKFVEFQKEGIKATPFLQRLGDTLAGALNKIGIIDAINAGNEALKRWTNTAREAAKGAGEFDEAVKKFRESQANAPKPDAPLLIDGEKVRAEKDKAIAAMGEMDAEAKSIMEGLRTPSEEMAANIQKIADAYARGILTADEFALANKRTMAKVEENILEATSTGLGGFAKLFEGAAKENKAFGVAYKAFAITQATIDTYLAANKAYASTFYPFNIIAAAGIVAAGLANVARITSQSFQTGGSFTVGGTGGIDSQMVAIRATPGEMVNIRKPGTTGAASEVMLPAIKPRDLFTGEVVREMVRSLNEAHADGYILKIREA